MFLLTLDFFHQEIFIKQETELRGKASQHGSIPGQGICLGFGLDPQSGAYRR